MEHIKSPFSEDDVNKLNEYQLSNSFHAFTCKDDGDRQHCLHEFNKKYPGRDYDAFIEGQKRMGIPFPEMWFNETKLIATKEGWICPVCNYKQDWAHKFMTQTTNHEEIPDNNKL